jgi:hypothetical protein
MHYTHPYVWDNGCEIVHEFYKNVNIVRCLLFTLSEWVMGMVFSATSNNISVISWRSVAEENINFYHLQHFVDLIIVFGQMCFVLRKILKLKQANDSIE